jgi:hypothetical protein
MKLETGKYFEKNQKRLDSLPYLEKEWAVALEKCRKHIQFRIKKRTMYGAHTKQRLGEPPEDYYSFYAYDAILSGRWDWKDRYTLSEQLIVIVDSTISTEVEKMDTIKAQENKIKVIHGDMDVFFYDRDEDKTEVDAAREILFAKQVSVVEELIKGDTDLEYFWEGIKEGMKRVDIAAFMDKTPKQLDKVRERFIKKIKDSPYFEME